MAASQIAPPIVVRASGKHSASGDGWASVFKSEIRLPYVKSIFPNAQSRPVTLNFGMRMPAWYDILGLSTNSPEDEAGINEAKNYVHSLINEEIAAGIPSKRIAIGGFSMGGALALYAGLTFDKPLGCIISMSGFLLQRSKIPGNHTANLRTPIFLGHGRDDFLVPYTFGQLTQQALSVFNTNVAFHSYPCQHGSTPQEHQDILAFIKTHIPPQEDSGGKHQQNDGIDTKLRSKL